MVAGTANYRRAVRSAMRSSTGTQDFTVAGFGTPKAALIQISTAVSSGARTNTASYSVGFTDGTNHSMMSFVDVDNVANSITARTDGTARVAALLNLTGTATLVEISFSAWITDGIRLNVTKTDGVSYLVTVILFGGDCSASVGSFNIPNGSAGQSFSVTSLAFQPTLIFFMSNFQAVASTTITANAILSLGIGSNCQGFISNLYKSFRESNNAANATPSSDVGSNRVNELFTDSAATLPLVKSQQVTLTAFLSNGFTVVSELVGDPGEIAYMAIDTGTIKIGEFNIAAPAATGVVSTPTSFQGGCAFILPSKQVGGGEQTLDECFGLGVNTQSEQFCMTTFVLDNAATMDTSSMNDANAIAIPANIGKSWSATGSFGTLTYDLNFTTVSNPLVPIQWVLIFERPIFSGSGSGNFPSLTGTGTGQQVFSGSSSGNFPSLTGTGTGQIVFAGSTSALFPSPEIGSGIGALVYEGVGAGTFPSLTGTASGLEIFQGNASSNFPTPTVSGVGVQVDIVVGTGSGTFPMPTSSGTGQHVFAATGAANFPMPVVEGAGLYQDVFPGVGSGNLPSPTAQGLGQQVFEGIGVGTFPMPFVTGTNAELLYLILLLAQNRFFRGPATQRLVEARVTTRKFEFEL